MNKLLKCKGWIISFVIVLLVLAASACGGNEEETGKTSTEPDMNREARVEAVVDRQYINKARQLIGEAKHSLHISQLYMNYDQVVRDLLGNLEEAAARGVEITVLLNQAENPADRNRKAIKRLEKVGVQIKEAERYGAGKLHAKMIVADRQRALVGSTNWSAMSIRNNHETNLYVDQPKIADFYARWIEKLYDNPGDDPQLKPVKHKGLQTVTGRKHKQVIPRLLENAQEKIWLGIYVFKTYFGSQYEGSHSDRMVQKLADAKQRGVEVRVMLDSSDYNEMINKTNAETAAHLLEAGIPVRATPEHLNAHWKLLIADEQTLVGSMNWGYSGFDLHAEASLLTETPAAVGELEKYFLSRWQDAKEYPTE
ncbi:MAG: phospholipase D-like domain-containing protein [bacterium]